MSEYEKANLVFLDAIERAASGTNISIKDLRAALESFMQEIVVIRELKSSIDNVVNSGAEVARIYTEGIKSIPAASIKNKIDISPVMSAIKNFEQVANMHAAKQTETIDRHYAVISGLLNSLNESISKEKKWRMKIDRNYNTKLIQDVVIEQVKE